MLRRLALITDARGSERLRAAGFAATRFADASAPPA